MYYAQKYINGVLYCQTKPKGEWRKVRPELHVPTPDTVQDAPDKPDATIQKLIDKRDEMREKSERLHKCNCHTAASHYYLNSHTLAAIIDYLQGDEYALYRI